MYTTFFQLAKAPFTMTPDPSFLFLTPQHREAVAGITYAILGRKGFLVLSGMAGTGKTTTLASVLRGLPPAHVRSSVILNPTLNPSEFLELAMIDFGITDIPASKAQRLWKLQSFLLQARDAGQICALIVDEAHKLSLELLEEIRLLGNFEQPEEKLLQILLIGQSELDEVLNRHELWQFKQRISVRLSIHPLAPPAIEEYIAHRWSKAGGTLPHPFSTEAVGQIAVLSQGVPRLINSLCDSALMLAFAESIRKVEAEHVNSVGRDLQLTDEFTKKAEAPVVPAPAPPPLPAELPVRMKMLERYSAPAPKSSFWLRWAGKLGIAG
jgi:general secretion pathway protein A